MEQARKVEMASNNATCKWLAKQHGIKGTPILSCLSSISFPSSFPFDFMHLIWENLIPNLILFWTGKFKDLDHQGKDYVIEPRIWDEVGAATAACSATIPVAFGAPVPNMAGKRSYMSAEMYANWTLYIAPIVLRGRFKKPQYYKHFMRLVELLKLCLVFEISEAILNQLDEGFRLWVQDYENEHSSFPLTYYTQIDNRLYHENDPARLSTCSLTVHALLHIVWGIRVAGPVWTYWAYPMERHCNTLLLSIKSRCHPYASINSFVTATAQLDQIRLLYDIHEALL